MPRTDLGTAVFHILVALAGQDRHGYSIMQDVAARTDGAIRRLLEDRWIERFEQEDTSRDKQAYRLTATGRTQLNTEIARLRHLLQSATTRLGLKEA